MQCVLSHPIPLNISHGIPMGISFPRTSLVFGVIVLKSFQSSKLIFWIYSSSFSLNFLLVRSQREEIIIVKRFIQVRSNVTGMRIEPKSCHHGRRKNDTFTHSATLPTILAVLRPKQYVLLKKEVGWL